MTPPICKNCRFAEWQRNQNGNLYRDVAGRCTHPILTDVKSMPIPQCATVVVSHRGIWRRDVYECLVFEPIVKGGAK
jgi:hypothetical protein